MAHKSAKRYTVLLSVRKRQEDIKGQALAVVRQEHTTLRRQRRELEEQRRGVLKSASIAPGTSFEPARHHALYQYERHLGKLTDEKDAEIGLHARKVQVARAELETAMARRRIMEKLIERVDRAERARVARREQRALDESSVIRYVHLQRTQAAGEAEDHEDSRVDSRGGGRVYRGHVGAGGD